MDAQIRAYLQKMQSADWLHRQASLKNIRADEIQHDLDNPKPEGLWLDPVVTEQEIASLRKQASECTARAAEIERAMVKPPTPDMIREVNEFFRRNHSQAIDRDRNR